MAANNTVDIDITRVNGSEGEISVGWEMLPGSALAGEDYVDQSGVLTWQADNTDSKTISIQVTDNDVNEAKEQFFVRLFNPTNGATLSSPHYTTVTIEGKKIAGAIGFEHSQLALNEQSGTTKIQVYRVGGSDGTVSVSYELSADSATIDEDIVNASGTLEWQDGDMQPKSIDLILINDELLEQDESLTLTLSANNDAVLASNSALIVTIKDDDSNTAPVLTISESFEVNTSQTANLTSSATDAESDEITFQWRQTSGPSISLINSTMSEASFVAPLQAMTLEFTVTATDSRGAASEKSVIVTVKQSTEPKPTNPDISGGSLYYLLLMLLGLITLNQRRRV
ncbi:MAG: Calx-beta domain-containing protein [Psychrobium sp.]